MKTNIRVNDTTHQLSLNSRLTLLDALRDALGLTGTKKGCDQDACGARTVIINGPACLVLSDAFARGLLTIEELTDTKGSCVPFD